MQRNAIFLDEQNILQGFSSPPAGKSFSESSETFLPLGKYFPDLRKPSCRRENTFRIFGNLPATRKILSGSSETFLPPGKYFPDLRKPSRRQEKYFPDLRKPSCRQEIVFRLKRISYRKAGCMVFAANLIISIFLAQSQIITELG